MQSAIRDKHNFLVCIASKSVSITRGFDFDRRYNHLYVEHDFRPARTNSSAFSSMIAKHITYFDEEGIRK